MFSRFNIVIPFYNEEENVKDVFKSLIRECKRAGLNIMFVLVNNGSIDRTGEHIKSLEKNFKEVKRVEVQRNLGYGYGIKQGLKICKSDYVGYMWGDGQTQPKDLVRVLKELILDPSLDICKVVRVNRYDSWKRKIVSFIYNKLFCVVFGIRTRDVNGTPKIFKRKFIKGIKLISDDWFIDAELMIKAKQKKAKIREIECEFYPRKKGFSSVNFLTILEFLKNIATYKIFHKL